MVASCSAGAQVLWSLFVCCFLRFPSSACVCVGCLTSPEGVLIVCCEGRHVPQRPAAPNNNNDNFVICRRVSVVATDVTEGRLAQCSGDGSVLARVHTHRFGGAAVQERGYSPVMRYMVSLFRLRKPRRTKEIFDLFHLPRRRRGRGGSRTVSTITTRTVFALGRAMSRDRDQAPPPAGLLWRSEQPPQSVTNKVNSKHTLRLSPLSPLSLLRNLLSNVQARASRRQ